MGHWPPNDTFSPTELEQTLQLISTPLSCPQVREVKYEDGFGVKNGDDIVQFWIQGEWQNSPNELWGWWFVPMAWADDHYVADLWDPKVSQRFAPYIWACRSFHRCQSCYFQAVSELEDIHSNRCFKE